MKTLTFLALSLTTVVVFMLDMKYIKASAKQITAQDFSNLMRIKIK